MHCSALLLFPRSGFEIGDMHVLIIGADAVDDAIIGDLNDPVGDGLRELMVMAGEDDIVLEGLKAVVERGDAFKVEVVRRLIEHEEVCAGEHHAAEHAPDLLTAGENLDAFIDIVPGEEHAPEEGAQIALALV